MNILINWCFFLYMAILFAERTQSLVNNFLLGQDYAFATFMRGSYNIIVIVSEAITLVLLFLFNRDFLKALFTNEEVNYKNLCLTSGVLLLSGMIHTEFTILYIQFIAYAFLILALLFEVLIQRKGKNPALLWTSFLYLVSYSMAIPVNYITRLEGSALFHSLELFTTLITILYFIYMCDKLFLGEGEHLFFSLPFFLMLLGDIFLIVFRWNEEINFFLLIAVIVTSVLFLIGRILEYHYKEEEKN